MNSYSTDYSTSPQAVSYTHLNEINFDYVRSHGIEYYRRKSGGGCVYADFSNIMFSYITDDFNLSFTFDRYLQLIAHTLNKLGVKAVASGRNDITVDGNNVSGNAFYRTSGRSIVHGTMLFDTNLEDLVLSITHNNEKPVSYTHLDVYKRQTINRTHPRIKLHNKEFPYVEPVLSCHREGAKNL